MYVYLEGHPRTPGCVGLSQPLNDNTVILDFDKKGNKVIGIEFIGEYMLQAMPNGTPLEFRKKAKAKAKIRSAQQAGRLNVPLW